MKYYYDTEFLEDGKTIDLISIGIVAEDGREYYAISKEADWERIDRHEWLMKNVVPQLPEPRDRPDLWKTRAEIAEEVKEFLLFDKKPKLWHWYGAYDHVVLCQLWGSMIDLPAGIPMFSADLRSMMTTGQAMKLPPQPEGLHDALEDARHLKVRYDWFYGQSKAPEVGKFFRVVNVPAFNGMTGVITRKWQTSGEWLCDMVPSDKPFGPCDEPSMFKDWVFSTDQIEII